MLEESRRLKDLGNKEFQQKNFLGAIECYKNALEVAHPEIFRGQPDNIIKKLFELSNQCLNNLRFCPLIFFSFLIYIINTKVFMKFFFIKINFL